MIKAKMTTPMRVFVLLFNARTENEGIHTVGVCGIGAAMGQDVPGTTRPKTMLRVLL